MRKLILEEWMTLDGHVTDKNGQLDFFESLTAKQNKYSDQVLLKFMETVDTILLGRKTYELFKEFWPQATTAQEVMADKINETKKIVFSKSLTAAPWGKWDPVEIIPGDLVTEIKKLKSTSGKNMVLWGSILVAQALMKENLIDEYHIQLCPVITGGGRKLFTEEPGINALTLTESRKYDTGVMFLNYKPAR